MNVYQQFYVLEEIRRRRIAALALGIIREREERALQRRRRKWVREWIQSRTEGRGALAMVQNELRLQDPESYRNYLRMDEAVFEELLARIAPLIQKRDTVMRQAISPRQRLIATLRFLASGNTYKDLAYAVRIPHNTLSGIIPHTMQAIVTELMDECIKCPTSSEEWQNVESAFRTLWNFPHCVGALDGKHINFRPPRQSGSLYRNYKGRDSIVLLALVDATYKFLYIDVGRNGRMNDGAVFRDSTLATNLTEGSLNLPSAKTLPGDVSQTQIPYVITADDAFPLSVNLMKPYPNRGLSYEQRIFNYRLSRARRVVENAFGILANRFRILLTTISLSANKVQLITLTCCILHNFILSRKPVALNNINGEEPETTGEEFHCSLRSVPPQGGNNPTQNAKAVRDHFRHYYNTVGSVAWQHDAVMRGNY